MKLKWTQATRDKFQNVLYVYLKLSRATIIFWPELNSSFFILVQGLFWLNRAKLGKNGPITIRAKFQK